MAPSLMLQEFDCMFYVDSDTFSNIHGIPIAKDPIGLIASSGHPLARLEEADLYEFKDDDFVFMTTSTGSFEQSYQLCLKSGFTPRIRAKTTSGLVQLRFVSAHGCVAFSSQSDHPANKQQRAASGISFIRLKQTLPDQTICLAFPCEAKLSPVAHLFRDFALRHLGVPANKNTLEVFEHNK